MCSALSLPEMLKSSAIQGGRGGRPRRTESYVVTGAKAPITSPRSPTPECADFSISSYSSRPRVTLSPNACNSFTRTLKDSGIPGSGRFSPFTMAS